MSNEIAKNDPEIDRQKQMIEVVKKSIFPKADDAELALYFHKCAQVGVHPLDKAIIPIKFKNQDGTFTVSFIMSIDLFRSRSEEAGDYEGMDEPEFEGTIKQEHQEYNEATGQYEDADPLEVPALCRVRVYRKGIPRPFIGVARWKEYYPGQKKGSKWRQMPTVMLSKCAEAIARRLGWAQKLNKLYTEEEMMLSTAVMAGVHDTTKAEMSGPTGAPDDLPADADEYDPSDDERKASKCISHAQEKRIYAICKSKNVDAQNVKNWIAVIKRTAKGHFHQIQWTGKPSEYDKICKTIDDKPEFFMKYATVKTETDPPLAVKQTVPSEYDQFELNCQIVAESKGKNLNDAITKLCTFFNVKTLSEIPAEKRKEAIDHISNEL
jgi:phage recombination protein Bet